MVKYVLQLDFFFIFGQVRIAYFSRWFRASIFAKNITTWRRTFEHHFLSELRAIKFDGFKIEDGNCKSPKGTCFRRAEKL